MPEFFTYLTVYLEFRENVVVFARLGVLRGRGDAGGVGRRGEPVLDAGDAGGTSDLVGFSEFVSLYCSSRTALTVPRTFLQR